MRKFTCLVVVTALAACGGSGKTFVGGVTADPDLAGVFTGVDADNVSVVKAASGNGFSYGFTGNVDATIVGNSGGSASGDRGQFTIAGLLPDVDVGAPITAGTASFTGEYALVTYTGYAQSPSVGTWTREDFDGAMTATVRLDTSQSDDVSRFDELKLDARSDDGRIVIDDVVIADSLGGLGRSATQPISMEIDGQQVSPRMDMVVGQAGIAAAIAGETGDVLYAGGFVLDADD
jgi:hypothetical protein